MAQRIPNMLEFMLAKPGELFVIFDDLGQCLGFAKKVSLDGIFSSPPGFVTIRDNGLFAQPTFSRCYLYCRGEDVGTSRGWRVFKMTRDDMISVLAYYQGHLAHIRMEDTFVDDPHFDFKAYSERSMNDLEELLKNGYQGDDSSLVDELMATAITWRQGFVDKVQILFRDEHDRLAEFLHPVS